jgi:hypothetical protein
MNTQRLGSGGRIGAILLAVETIKIKSAGMNFLDDPRMISMLLGFQRNDSFLGRDNMHLNPFGPGCPNAELARSRTLIGSS